MEGYYASKYEIINSEMFYLSVFNMFVQNTLDATCYLNSSYVLLVSIRGIVITGCILWRV